MLHSFSELLPAGLMVMIILAAGILLLKLLSRPIKLVFKLLLHAAVGFLTLLLINAVGSAFAISVPITWLTSIVAGILGLPGVVILLILRYLL